MSAAPPRRLVALYEWTTRLMPASHREQYGSEQVRLFDRLWREERPSGQFASAWWASVLLSQSVRAALGARFDQWRRVARTRTSHTGGGGQLGSDLRFALRAMKASPWYAVAVVSVIGVTLALATTTFAIADGVLFRPLPYPEADRLVSIQPGFRDAAPSPSREVFSPASLVDLANWHAAVPEAEFTGFSAARAAESGPGIGLNNDTSGIAEVQANFFSVIGVHPLFGGFSEADFAERAHYRPVILMYDTWQARFGGDANVLGKIEMLIRPRDFGLRVVGVMPRGFTFPSTSVTVDFLAPNAPPLPTSSTDPRSRGLREVVARLPEAMRPDQLVERLAPGLAATAVLYDSLGPREGFDPKTERAFDDVRVTGLSASLARRSGDLFLAVVVAAALLILLAAANVSSLMTSRALERRDELQVRRSLGANTGAIVRLWTIEAGVLLAVGTLVGVLIAAPFLTLIVSLLPQSVVLLKAPRLDWRVAGFVIVTMGVLCTAVSAAPIRWSLRLSSNGPARGGSSERVRTPGRFAVVAGQVAVAFVLTTVGACLVGSLLVVYGNDLPIRIEGVIVLESRLHGPGGRRTPADTVERVARGRMIRDRLRRIPGVTEVGLVEAEVLRDAANNRFSRPEGVVALAGLDSWGVTGAFYQVVEPVVVAGRLPTKEELEAGEPLIVVSERVARAYWPGRDAIGQSLTDLKGKEAHIVIGVVRDVRWQGWDIESPMIYGPYSRLTNSPFQTYFIRTEVSPASTIEQAVKAVVEADPTMRPRTAATLEEMYGASVALRRFQSWLFGGFAAAALVVVGVGILGLLAMSAARRTREVGIRCALGATPGSVTSLMVREQLSAVGVGLLAGGAVAAWAVGFVEGYLYQLTASDPRIWSAAAVSILTMAAIGTLVPAIRASRIDPLKALRVE